MRLSGLSDYDSACLTARSSLETSGAISWNCCQIYLQSQAGKVSSGTHCAPVLVIVEASYLQRGNRNYMEVGELWSAYLWQYTEKGTMSFIAFLLPSTPDTWTLKKNTKNTCMGAATEEGGSMGEWRNRRLLFQWRPGKGVSIKPLGEEPVRARRTGLSLHWWGGAKGWKWKSIREKRFGQRCRRGVFFSPVHPPQLWGLWYLTLFSYN